MATEQANRDSIPRATDRRALWGRRLAVATAVVFVISSAFPAVAAFVRDTEAWPRWWGVLDVIIAFVLASLAFVVLGLAQGRVTEQAEGATYRTYRVLTHGILVGPVVFYLLGDRIVWGQCLSGFAWRTWLLLYCLPAWWTAFNGPTGERSSIPPRSAEGAA